MRQRNERKRERKKERSRGRRHRHVPSRVDSKRPSQPNLPQKRARGRLQYRPCGRARFARTASRVSLSLLQAGNVLAVCEPARMQRPVVQAVQARGGCRARASRQSRGRGLHRMLRVLAAMRRCARAGLAGRCGRAAACTGDARLTAGERVFLPRSLVIQQPRLARAPRVGRHGFLHQAQKQRRMRETGHSRHIAREALGGVCTGVQHLSS
jgi:hypothetical protein